MNDAIQKKRGSSALLILLVVFVFMVCSLFLILYGANVYRSITVRADTDFARRMSVSYITNKIRACDVRGGVEILNDGEGLILRAGLGAEKPLYIYIYHYGGFIMEYITDIPDEYDPENGENIMEATGLSVCKIPGGIDVTINTNIGEMTYTVALRCY